MWKCVCDLLGRSFLQSKCFCNRKGMQGVFLDVSCQRQFMNVVILRLLNIWDSDTVSDCVTSICSQAQQQRWSGRSLYHMQCQVVQRQSCITWCRPMKSVLARHTLTTGAKQHDWALILHRQCMTSTHYDQDAEQSTWGLVRKHNWRKAGHMLSYISCRLLTSSK